MAKRYGNFTVVEKIAQGAMGEIFLVEDEAENRFALKTLRQNLGLKESSESKSRFLREISLCENVNHPNIVNIHCFDLDFEQPYMVMEYLSGGSLEERIDEEGALETGEVLKIAVDMCRALIEIEKCGIIHRDIKPANILISNDGDYKLSDLGLARMSANVRGAENLTMSQTALGTPYYIAPEQALDAKTADIRSDIYSLGATLYYAFTGRRVHEGTSSVHVMMKHLNEDITHPGRIRKDAPANLTVVIMKMLEKEPENRYQTPGSLLMDLEKIQEFDAPPEELLASGMVLNKSGSSNKTGTVMFSFLIGLIFIALLAIFRVSCLPPSGEDKIYLKARLALKTVEAEKSTDFLNSRADKLENFLINYPTAKDAELIRRAAKTARVLATAEVFHVTVKKVGNLKEPRSFSFRIFIDGVKFEFSTKERKQLLFPEARIVFNWKADSAIKLEFEEFEWLDDVIYSAQIPDFFSVRALSGNKIYKVSPKFSEYFTDGELHVEYELDEINEADWKAFEEYFFPATAW